MIARLTALLVVALVATSCSERGDVALRPTSTVAPTAPTRSSTTSTPTTAPTSSSRPQVTLPGHDDPPEPPGALLRADELESGDLPGSVHRVLYRSRATTGRDTTVSGLVAIPDTPPPAGGHPVLAWAHGTTGVGDDCAPSRRGAAALPRLREHLEDGYVVAATDYEGLGTPGIHPYLVAESEGRAVLDSVRAARQLAGTEVTSRRFVTIGHSQGGHAALAAAERVGTWAPELELVGTAALAPVADLERIIPVLFDSTIGLALGTYVAAGWPAAYPELEPGDLLTPAGIELLRDAREACVFEMVERMGEEVVDDLRVSPPAEVPAWAARIAENDIDATRVDTPVLIAQGGEDRIVPRPLVDGLVDDLCASGVPLRYLSHGLADHSTIVGASMPAVHRWVERLLAERPARDDCR